MADDRLNQQSGDRRGDPQDGQLIDLAPRSWNIRLALAF